MVEALPLEEKKLTAKPRSCYFLLSLVLYRAFPHRFDRSVATYPGNKITLPKLKVALALAGVLLTNEELHILEHGFRSDRSADMV